MKRVFILAILINFIFAKELVITKFIENRPSISITFEGNKNWINLLKMDLRAVDHFKWRINQDLKNSYKFKFIAYDKALRVKYYNNKGDAFLIKIYRTNNNKNYPFLIHKAVYDINKYFNLPDVKFLTRKVVYAVSNSPKETSIYLADYTLTYKKLIVSGGVNIFPKWIDSAQTEIFYTKYKKYPVLYRLNILTGKQKKVLVSNGMLVVSDIKGDKVLLTLAPKGQPDIYEYNLKTKDLKRLTTYNGIDVNGKFWGDDKIVFISNRFNTPFVFQKDILTNKTQRVLYHGRNQVGVDTYKNFLVVSSRETNKVFARNTFNLFLINKNSDSLKRLTLHGQNSFPNFSVDGNSIMFIKTENFTSKLGLIRLKENKIFYYPLSKKLQSFDW